MEDNNIKNKLKIYSKDGGFEREIELSEDKSILDDMLDNDVQVFYGCLGGSCSACICKIESGMEFIDREALGNEIYKGVEKDEILTCISRVKKGVKGKTIELKKKL